MTSVNVDSEIAAKEREALLKIAEEADQALKSYGKRCLICGGHGAVSVLGNGTLKTFGQTEHYKAGT